MDSSDHKALAAVVALTLITGAIVMLPDQQNFVHENLQADPPTTVSYVDPSRYVGLWYQQAAIPQYYETNCIDTTALYSMVNAETLSVKNSCYQNGKDIDILGNATIEDTTTNAKLAVKFQYQSNIGQYWIVKLGDTENYGYSVVSTPDYSSLWILSRNTTMDQTTYDSIIAWLKEQGGYQVDKLVRTLYTPFNYKNAASQPIPVSYVDPSRFMGHWYQQAVIPYFFQTGCQDTQTDYSLINSTTIRVENECWILGEKVDVVGKAIIENSGNSKL